MCKAKAMIGNKDYDPAMLVRFVTSHPDAAFRARLEALAERVTPEAFERICAKIYKAWGHNGDLALTVAEEFSERAP